tara:strand:- start:515 stop:796 length:282 start_codon:yes stop_codon:yes gene_type:complete
MCESLGKKNFNKVGLIAMIIEENLQQLAREANLTFTVELLTSISHDAKRKAIVSPLLKLKRSELESLAAEVKGPHQNWGTFAGFARSNFSKQS